MLYKELLKGRELSQNYNSGIIHVMRRKEPGHSCIHISYCGLHFGGLLNCELTGGSKVCRVCLKSVKTESNWPGGNNLITVKYTTADGKEFGYKKDALEWAKQHELGKQIAEWMSKKLEKHRWKESMVYCDNTTSPSTVQEAMTRFLIKYAGEIRQLLR